MTELDCMLVADPNGKSWEFALDIYKNLKKKSEKFHLNEVHVQRFRDGEIKTKIKDNVRQKKCFFIHDSSKNPAEWFLELLLVNETLKNSSAYEVNDVLPYLKFSRQDRKDESRVPISARVVADCISVYASRIITSDVHSPQIQGFYRIPFDNLYTFSTILGYLKNNHPEILENLVIMSPDAGGADRAKSFAKRLGTEEFVVGYKHRKVAGEVAEFKLLGDVKDKNVLIIDDMIDSGNSLVEAAKKTKEQGAKKVFAYATHGLFNENAREKLSKELDKTFVSNSIPQQDYENIETISLVDLFSEAIYRTNEGLSLSELFR